jgi:hypothetical protein
MQNPSTNHCRLLMTPEQWRKWWKMIGTSCSLIVGLDFFPEMTTVPRI